MRRRRKRKRRRNKGGGGNDCICKLKSFKSGVLVVVVLCWEWLAEYVGGKGAKHGRAAKGSSALSLN